MAELKKKLVCENCGARIPLPSPDWEELVSVPWCASCFNLLWDLFKAEGDPSREGLWKAYMKHRGDPARGDQLLVQLKLMEPCQCNNHARR
jgi:hypothetical protein